MNLLDQSGETGGGLDPYNVHALFVNMDNMWTGRFGNYDCLVFERADQTNEVVAQRGRIANKNKTKRGIR